MTNVLRQAAGTGLIALIVALTNAGPVLAQGVLRPVEARIVNTTETPVPVSIVGAARSHMGVPVSDHVVLAWVAIGNTTACGQTSQEFRRILPDGSFDTTAFVVPQGRTFVVTDADAVIVAGTGNTFPMGDVVHARVMHADLFDSSLAPHGTNGVTITNGTTGAVAISSSLGAGFLVSAGKQVCIRGDSRAANTGFLFPRVTTASLRGYLL